LLQKNCRCEPKRMISLALALTVERGIIMWIRMLLIWTIQPIVLCFVPETGLTLVKWLQNSQRSFLTSFLRAYEHMWSVITVDVLTGIWYTAFSIRRITGEGLRIGKVIVIRLGESWPCIDLHKPWVLVWLRVCSPSDSNTPSTRTPPPPPKKKKTGVDHGELIPAPSQFRLASSHYIRLSSVLLGPYETNNLSVLHSAELVLYRLWFLFSSATC